MPPAVSCLFFQRADQRILRRRQTLTEPAPLQLKTLRNRGCKLDAPTRHVPSFTTMLTDRQGERLPEWLHAVRQDYLPSLHTLAAGIYRGLDAVIAESSLPWSSGAVEGHVNRIKMLKRQMFSRAGFEFLRKHVLLYAWIPGQESSNRVGR